MGGGAVRSGGGTSVEDNFFGVNFLGGNFLGAIFKGDRGGVHRGKIS